MGSTRQGIYTDSTDANIVIFGNMYFGVPYPVTSLLRQAV
jgi:hypothetical protein